MLPCLAAQPGDLHSITYAASDRPGGVARAGDMGGSLGGAVSHCPGHWRAGRPGSRALATAACCQPLSGAL